MSETRTPEEVAAIRRRESGERDATIQALRRRQPRKPEPIRQRYDAIRRERQRAREGESETHLQGSTS